MHFRTSLISAGATGVRRDVLVVAASAAGD
jgi:hypothetical protein